MAAPPITERHLHHFHRRSPIKEAVRVATTANITIATALNNGDSLDGITLATDDRVLVKNQSTASGNGIYVVGVTPVRAYDQSTDDPAFGFLVYVREGTVNGGVLYRNTNTTTPTIGTTALTFALTTSSFALTVKDEGSSLTTAATSIDFVGAGVAATGTGAGKTVTIAGQTFATPAIVLGTAAAAGAATTGVRTDATIVAFDATVPTTEAFGDSAATGSAAVAARRDHVHGMPASPSTGVGAILISDTPAGSPLVFADLIQNEAGTDLVYADI